MTHPAGYRGDQICNREARHTVLAVLRVHKCHRTCHHLRALTETRGCFCKTRPERQVQPGEPAASRSSRACRPGRTARPATSRQPRGLHQGLARTTRQTGRGLVGCGGPEATEAREGTLPPEQSTPSIVLLSPQFQTLSTRTSVPSCFIFVHLSSSKRKSRTFRTDFKVRLNI